MQGANPCPDFKNKKVNDMYKDAYIHGDYRYWLSRYWDDNKNVVGWIMLNPSTADHREDDPTIWRCINFSKSWGYGGILVVNLFAYRSSSPKNLLNCKDPIGNENDYYIKTSTKHCKIVIAAWGCSGDYKGRDKEVIKMFPDLMCLSKTKNGHPGHPLYLRKDLKPKFFNSIKL